MVNSRRGVPFFFSAIKSVVNNPKNNAICFSFSCAWRQLCRGTGRSNYKTASDLMSVLWAQHLPRRRLWRKPSPLMKARTQLRKLQRIDMVSVCSYHHDACTNLPSQPSPSDKTLQQWTTQLTERSKTNQGTLLRLTALHRQKTCRRMPHARPPQLFFVWETLQVRTALRMRKIAQHDVLHMWSPSSSEAKG